jgi:hypothetical protein
LLASQANSLVDSQPDVALRLAAAAYKIKETQETVEALTRLDSKFRHVDRLLVTDAAADPEIVFSPTDPAVVALASTNGVALWDVKKNTPLRRREADRASTPVFSPNGRILAFMQSTGREQTLTIWLHAENRIRYVSRVGPDEYLSGITFSPDGELLGACVQPPDLSPPRIQLWTVDPPGIRQSIPLSERSSCGFGFTGGNRGIAYIDGEEIVTWDVAEGRVTTRNRPGPPSSPGTDVFDRFLRSFSVAPDGRTAIYEAPSEGPYGGLSWWDLDRQAPLQGMEIPPPSGSVSISFTPDSRLAAVNTAGAVLVVDVARRMPLDTYSIGLSRLGGLCKTLLEEV